MSEPTPAYTEPPAAPLRRMSRVLGLLALGLAAVIFIFGVFPPLRGDAAVNWEQMPCTILESEVQTVVKEEPWGNSVRQYSVYVPHVRYTYGPPDAPRESDVVSLQPGESQRDPAQAQAIVEDYPVGSTQTCYVNPEDPSQSVLLRQPVRLPWLYALAGGLLGLAGLAGVFYAPRST